MGLIGITGVLQASGWKVQLYYLAAMARFVIQPAVALVDSVSNGDFQISGILATLPGLCWNAYSIIVVRSYWLQLGGQSVRDRLCGRSKRTNLEHSDRQALNTDIELAGLAAVQHDSWDDDHSGSSRFRDSDALH